MVSFSFPSYQPKASISKLMYSPHKQAKSAPHRKSELVATKVENKVFSEFHTKLVWNSTFFIAVLYGLVPLCAHTNPHKNLPADYQYWIEFHCLPHHHHTIIDIIMTNLCLLISYTWNNPFALKFTECTYFVLLFFVMIILQMCNLIQSLMYAFKKRGSLCPVLTNQQTLYRTRGLNQG